MLSILVPAYNEADSIVQTIHDLNRAMKTTSERYEILVIDDGSADDTAKLAEENGVRVVRHPSNGGYGRALKTGMFHASYDWCAIVDADGTYPLDRLPELLSYIPQFDMVVGARTGVHYWGSLGKTLGRTFLLGMVQYVVGFHVPDVNSGMRIFKKEIALAHISRISSGFSFTTTLTLAMLLDEHFVKYVPIEYHPRVGSSKVRIWTDTMRMLQILSAATLYYNPLKLFLPICLLAVGVGAVAGVIGASWFFFALSLLFAFLIGAIGFLAEAIRLHDPARSHHPPNQSVEQAAVKRKG